MEALYEELQGYLNMDEEISFEEFSAFYKRILAELPDKHESFSEDELWKALFIVENVMSNSDARAKETKGSESKKYVKMAQRLQLWSKNFAGRLHGLGYTDEEVNARFDAMFEEGPVNSK
ncbi:hypothetical protein [Alkalihalobacterium bogoriense]|uniref:hypothetical protein n=1 Tax=Alkalihalobacterium bogoriense TaxID=246272 RepID=UPI0004799F5B|nr:hypothetical protein [Alkalihalobacterium bogoriense]